MATAAGSPAPSTQIESDNTATTTASDAAYAWIATSPVWGWASKLGQRAVKRTVDLAKSSANYSQYVFSNNRDVYLSEPYNEKEWFDSIPKALRNDITFVLCMLKKFPSVERFLTGDIKKKVEISRDWNVLASASPEVKNDPKVIKLAVAQNGRALKFASDDLQNNHEIVKLAVTQNGWNLKYAGDTAKIHPDVIASLCPDDLDSIITILSESEYTPQQQKIFWEIFVKKHPETL
ncbi:MAG: DUF4116 domain-containing protein, partial [Rhabdochlamydiaceae bacterium]|nr:DUF4116 domain-containing protein [Candidatus Amphrikana amoebophyrae]